MQQTIRRTIPALVCVLAIAAAIAPAGARVGGGSSYRGAEADKEATRSLGTQEREERERSGGGPAPGRERQAPDRIVAITEKDYSDYRWFGIFMTVFLNLAGIGVTAFMVFGTKASRKDFVRGKVFPAGAVNLALCGMLFGLSRGFGLSLYAVFIALVVTVALLGWDGVRTLSANDGSGNGDEETKDSVEKSNPAELGKFDLQRDDPAFSLILLVDFVHALYHEFMGRLGSGEFDRISPFFSESNRPTQESYLKYNRRATEIVVGSVTLEGIVGEEKEWTAVMTLRANYTVEEGGSRRRNAVIERWTLARARGVQTPEPERMQTVSCPSCGAPANFTLAGKCGHCGTIVKNGLMQWYIRERAVEKTEEFSVKELVTYAAERGTALPTVMSPFFKTAAEELCREEGAGDCEDFLRRFSDEVVRGSFLALYEAWSTLGWEKARHLLTDRMYMVNNGWMEFYRRNGLVNRLEDIVIDRIVPVKVQKDLHYRAVTLRIFASCLDYVLDSEGKVAGGSRSTRRAFSEYWTFVKRVDSVKKGSGWGAITHCPACGSPADRMGDTAKCGYCGSRISSASFSWVLALITQDEEYQG